MAILANCISFSLVTKSERAQVSSNPHLFILCRWWWTQHFLKVPEKLVLSRQKCCGTTVVLSHQNYHGSQVVPQHFLVQLCKNIFVISD